MQYCVYRNKGISERYPLLLDVQSDIIDLGMGDAITADFPFAGFRCCVHLDNQWNS